MRYGGVIGWLSSWLAIYQPLSIDSIIASALLRVARAAIVYMLSISPCIGFNFMGSLRVSASYLLILRILSGICFLFLFILSYVFLSFRRLCFYPLVGASDV